MEINSNISFQANIPARLRHTLRNEALDKGPQILQHLNNKIKIVEKWGNKQSTLVIANDLTGNKQVLALDNKSISTLYGTCFAESKKGLLSSFMKLKKKDISKAEKEISNLVKNNQEDLISKALSSSGLMKKITGNENSSAVELRKIVSEMPESKICDLRFGLDEFKPNDEILDFII